MDYRFELEVIGAAAIAAAVVWVCWRSWIDFHFAIWRRHSQARIRLERALRARAECGRCGEHRRLRFRDPDSLNAFRATVHYLDRAQQRARAAQR